MSNPTFRDRLFPDQSHSCASPIEIPGRTAARRSATQSNLSDISAVSNSIGWKVSSNARESRFDPRFPPSVSTCFKRGFLVCRHLHGGAELLPLKVSAARPLRPSALAHRCRIESLYPCRCPICALPNSGHPYNGNCGNLRDSHSTRMTMFGHIM